MNKNDFGLLLSSGENSIIVTSSLGDGWVNSLTKRILVSFERITKPDTLKELFSKGVLFKPMGFGYEKSYVVQSFYFGYIGRSPEKMNNDDLRLSKAIEKYEKWKANLGDTKDE